MLCKVSDLNSKVWQSLDTEGSIGLSPAPSDSKFFPRDITARAAVLYLKSGKTNNITLLA